MNSKISGTPACSAPLASSGLDTHTPATACPPWCTVGKLHADGDHYHFGELTEAGPVRVGMEILDDDSAGVSVHVDRSAESSVLTLDEVDALIATLTAMRATLAADAQVSE